MKRFSLVEGNLVEDDNGPYMLVAEYMTNITTVKTQLDALDAYVDALQTYTDSIL